MIRFSCGVMTGSGSMFFILVCSSLVSSISLGASGGSSFTIGLVLGFVSGFTSGFALSSRGTCDVFSDFSGWFFSIGLLLGAGFVNSTGSGLSVEIGSVTI